MSKQDEQQVLTLGNINPEQFVPIPDLYRAEVHGHDSIGPCLGIWSQAAVAKFISETYSMTKLIPTAAPTYRSPDVLTTDI